MNHAQQASVLAASRSNVLGSDGTTLNQRKVQGTRLTLGVEPVADGSAKSLEEQLDKTLTTIRDVGSELEIPDYKNIGWGLITTIMSDQASSQKAFNRMIKDKIEEETVRDGRSNSGELVETYCGMHVGVNLRAAEVKGINKYIAESKKVSIGVDLIVHSVCKLLGHLGVNPEYWRGFPEFLQSALEDGRAAGLSTEYIEAARKLKLKR